MGECVHTCATVCTWKSEDNFQEAVLSTLWILGNQMGHQAQRQVPLPLNHLASTSVLFKANSRSLRVDPMVSSTCCKVLSVAFNPVVPFKLIVVFDMR